MTTPAPRAFDRVLVIMFENQYRGYALHNVYLKQLAQQGIELTNYYGVMHPSQTNYVASLAGELCNVSYDERVYVHPPKQPLPQRTIVDLLEEAGLTWKAYMQSFNPQQQPWTPDLIPADHYPYMVKHNAFASFERIVRNQARWNRIVDEYQFWTDVLSGQLPHYAWFTPNMWNDGHYVAGTRIESADPRAPQLVDQAAAWLETFFAALQFPGPNSKLPPRTLVVVTFDEAEFLDVPPPASNDAGAAAPASPVHGPNYNGPNQIYTVLLGDGIKPGTVSDGFNHYSLLKTIERNFGLGTLGKNDVACNSFDCLWGREFQWGTPAKTPVETSGPLAAAACQNQLHVVSTGSQGTLQSQTFDGTQWSAAQNLGVNGGGGIALAATCDGLMLVFQAGDQSLSAVSCTPQHGWSKTVQKVVNQPVGSFAVSPLDVNRLMLVFQAADKQLQSLTFANGAWETTPVAVGQQTDGDVALTLHGTSVFLMFKIVGSDGMNVLTYNTADYNVVTIPDGKTNGPCNNTTKDAWSPSPFPVSQFGIAPHPASDPASGSKSKLSAQQIAKLKAELAAKLPPDELALLKEEIEARFEPEPAPVLIPSTARGPLVAAVLDGVIHLAHPGTSNSQVRDETFSISGLMSPKLPIANGSGGKQTTSNGFGTLAQAGWGAPASVANIQQDPARGMAIAKVKSELILLFQPDASGRVQMIQGSIRSAT